MRARVELKELCMLYLFVVDAVGERYDVSPALNWSSDKCAGAPMGWTTRGDLVSEVG